MFLAGKQGDHQQDGDDGNILEYQDAQRVAPEIALDLAGFIENLEHDGGGGKRQSSADNRAAAGVNTQQPVAGKRENNRGNHYLQGAEQEYLAAHALEVPDRELQADGEHQEHHPELGHGFQRGVAVELQVEGIADDRAGQNIADDGRHVDALERHVEHGGKRNSG